jgi:hypothetical protein
MYIFEGLNEQNRDRYRYKLDINKIRGSQQVKTIRQLLDLSNNSKPRVLSPINSGNKNVKGTSSFLGGKTNNSTAYLDSSSPTLARMVQSSDKLPLLSQFSEAFLTNIRSGSNIGSYKNNFDF